MKKVLLGIFIFVGGIWVYPTENQAAISLPIYSISGNAFQDNNQNGAFDISKLDFGLKNETVALYSSLQDAKNNVNPLKSVKTNSLGAYSFTSLKQGSYFIKYNQDQTSYQAIALDKNPSNELGGKITGIVPISIKKEKLLYKENLPLRRVTTISITPFSDQNWNGVKEEAETILSGKTMIIVDLRRLAQAYQNGALKNIDTSAILSSALTSGDVNLLDGLYLRTTKNNQAIQMPDTKSGTYAMIRSPFNLTIGDSLNNLDRIQAILTILQNGDIEELLNNTDLLNTNDITTNNDNLYLKKLATVFQQLAIESGKINMDAVLSSNNNQLFSSVSTQLGKTANLLNSLPAYRLGVVTYFGDSFDITGLKIKKTNDFLFGIKNYATISGNVFSDLDNNGQKSSLELTGVNAKVIVYDTNGAELASTNTTSLNSAYKLAMLPYNTTLYLAVETDRPITPLLAANEVPSSLKNKKIVGSYTIDKYAVETVISQNIGAMSNTPNAVSLSLKEFNAELAQAKVTFTNTDKLKTASVFYSLNGGVEQSVTLDRAPVFGSAKPKEVILASTVSHGQNSLKAYWKAGVYQVPLADLTF